MERPITCKCKKCGEEIYVKTYPIINLQSEDAVFIDRLFSLDLFSITCPACQTIFTIQYNMIIVDMYKKYILYLVSPEDLTNNLSTSVSEVLSGFINNEMYKEVLDKVDNFRFVTDLNELLEKLLIFDYDLNDKIIEAMKFIIKNDENFEYTDLFFNKIDRDSLIFSCFNAKNAEKHPKNIGVNFSYYNALVDDTKIEKTNEKQFLYIGGKINE